MPLFPFVALLQLLACGPDPNAPPSRPDGVLEVHEVETSAGLMSASSQVVQRNDGCLWGREVWAFQPERISVQNDVLCPGKGPDEAYGCQVRVTADAVWDPARGVYTVAHRTAARARFVGTPDSELDPGPRTHCRVELEAGEYPFARVRNGEWKWEMRTPAGTVYRMDTSDARAEFGSAMRDLAKGGK
jgi:hypothetical protein